MELIDGVVPYKPEDIDKYIRLNWWRGLTLGDLLVGLRTFIPTRKHL